MSGRLSKWGRCDGYDKEGNMRVVPDGEKCDGVWQSCTVGTTITGPSGKGASRIIFELQQMFIRDRWYMMRELEGKPFQWYWVGRWKKKNRALRPHPASRT